MATYIGYVVGRNETNPFSIFIPARSGISSFKSSKGFGTNAGNWGLDELGIMIGAAEKCYLSSELSSNCGNFFDDANGYATVEENQFHLDGTTAKDVRGDKLATNSTSEPLESGSISSPFFYPSVNLVRSYWPSSINGNFMNSFTNVPGGKYTTLRVGSKVLVDFPDGSGVGYIIRQLPDSDQYSQAIKKLLK